MLKVKKFLKSKEKNKNTGNQRHCENTSIIIIGTEAEE